MWSNYCTNISNPVLFHYEAKPTNVTYFPHEYHSTSMYIDNLVAINKSSRNQDEIKNVYTNCMELEETVAFPVKSAHYLALNIN